MKVAALGERLEVFLHSEELYDIKEKNQTVIATVPASAGIDFKALYVGYSEGVGFQMLVALGGEPSYWCMPWPTTKENPEGVRILLYKQAYDKLIGSGHLGVAYNGKEISLNVI
jgi:hypothetical protein